MMTGRLGQTPYGTRRCRIPVNRVRNSLRSNNQALTGPLRSTDNNPRDHTDNNPRDHTDNNPRDHTDNNPRDHTDNNPPDPPHHTPPHTQPPGYPSYGYTAPVTPLSREQDIFWASLTHLSGILWFLPGLIIWSVFRGRGPFVNQEGKEAVNFQITAVIALFATFFVSWIPYIGWTFPLVVWMVLVIFSVIGFAQAQRGRAYRYPLSLRLIR